MPALPTGRHSQIRRAAQPVTDLKRGRLLPFQPVRVERVDQRDRLLLGDLHHQREGIIERALHLHHLRAVGHRAGQFARRHFALRNQHDRAQPGSGSVGRSGSGRIAGGGADHRLHAAPGGFADRHGHATVFERTGGIHPLKFDPQLETAAQFLRQARHWDQRCIAF